MGDESERPNGDPAADQPPDPGNEPGTAAERAPPHPPAAGVVGRPEIDLVLTESTVDVDSQDIDSGPSVRVSDHRLWVVKDEVVRAAVALLLFFLLAYVIYMAFQRAKTWDETKQLLDGVLPAVTALLGSAVGFYFGAKAG